MLISRVLKSWARQFVACMGGCLGGCVRPTPIIAVDEPSEGLKIQRESGEGPNLSDDFWFTSTNKMDNSTAPSQRSGSSISVSNRNADISGTNANSNNEFVNHDLNLWNEMRRQWVGDRPRNQPRQPRELVLSHGSSWTSSGCLGGCARPTPIIAVDEPSKGLKIQGESVKGPNFSDDFWSTSTNEMDNSTAPAQRSGSSISVSNPNADIRGTNTNSNNSEFVNHSLC